MKKVLSLIVVLAMLISAIPAAFAAEGNDWEGEIDVVSVAVVNNTGYATVQEAVDAANGGVVKLMADSNEEITATDLYLDLNGYSLKKVTVTGTLYGMDSTTNEYTASGAKIETVDGTYASNYRNDDSKRYLAVAEGEGISFHCFYMGITKLSLAPAVTGFGYKAEFYGDEKVQAQVANIGYDLWLTEDRVISKTTGFKNTLTLRLKNFMVAQYGETPVNAKVYMTLNDGTKLESTVHSYSMRDVVEEINNTYTEFDSDKLQAVAAMIQNNATMQAWTVANIVAAETE